MRRIELNRFASLKLWEGELPDAAYRGEVAQKALGKAEIRSVPPRYACLEAFIPRGGMAEYGLLGGHFQPNAAGRLVLEVITGERKEVLTFQSLAQDVDDVRIGLPGEYSTVVLAATLDRKDLASGIIRIDHAAHGLAGSSTQLFEKLANALVLLLHGEKPSDEELRKQFME